MHAISVIWRNNKPAAGLNRENPKLRGGGGRGGEGWKTSKTPRLARKHVKPGDVTVILHPLLTRVMRAHKKRTPS